MRKSTRHLEFTEALNLTPYMQGRIETPVFMLKSVAVHSSRSTKRGHWTIYVCDDAAQWWHIDDDYVRRSHLAEVLTCQASLLHYARSFVPAIGATAMTITPTLACREPLLAPAAPAPAVVQSPATAP